MNEDLEEVKEFRYLGSNVCANGDKEVEISHRLSERPWMMGGLDRLENYRSVYCC